MLKICAMLATLYVSLLLSAHLSRSHGMALLVPEKRGWTLNSAGYLLGPYAHRTLTGRHGTTVGKRNEWEAPMPKAYKSYLQTLLDLITYLRLKDAESVELQNSSIFHDNMRQ